MRLSKHGDLWHCELKGRLRSILTYSPSFTEALCLAARANNEQARECRNSKRDQKLL